MKRSVAGALVLTIGALFSASAAGAVTITEFDVNPGKNTLPEQIVAGPGGNLWFTQAGVEAGIGRMSPTGELLPVILDSNGPVDLAAAPSGWVSWVSKEGVGTFSPTGTKFTGLGLKGGAIILTPSNEVRFGGGAGSSVTVVCTPEVASSDHIEGTEKCSGEKNGAHVEGLAASPAGTLWASIYKSDVVKIFESAPLVEQHVVTLPAESGPKGMAVGPEGNAWVAMWKAGGIDRITPDGLRTRFLLPAGSHPNDIVLGPDGAFWIVESGTGKIGRMTPAGVLTNEYPVPSGETGQTGITVGPDGNIWFTDSEEGKIGRLVPDPVLPGGGTNLPGSGSGADNVAPRFIGTPSFSPARFKVAGSAKARTSSKGGAPSGTTLRFSLSEAGTVTETIARKAPGRRLGSKCVAPGKAKPGAKKCARYLTKGALKLTGAAGANKVAFSGKLGRNALAPGGYRATLVARDAAANDSAPKTTSFTIVR